MQTKLCSVDCFAVRALGVPVHRGTEANADRVRIRLRNADGQQNEPQFAKGAVHKRTSREARPMDRLLATLVAYLDVPPGF